MIALLTALSAVFSAPQTDKTATICEVGRVALRDLPSIYRGRGAETYYGSYGETYRDLLLVCPALEAALPPGFPLANTDVLARLRALATKPGEKMQPVYVFTVGVPKLSGDGQSATVTLSYSCPGLCGEGYQASYVRPATGWERRGNIDFVWVS